MSGLDELKRAQARVGELRGRGADPTGRELKAAMNRLMSLIRHATPEEVAAFDSWRTRHDEGNSPTASGEGPRPGSQVPTNGSGQAPRRR